MVIKAERRLGISGGFMVENPLWDLTTITHGDLSWLLMG